MIKYIIVTMGVMLIGLMLWSEHSYDTSLGGTVLSTSKQQHRFTKMFQESPQHYDRWHGWENKAGVTSFEVFFDNNSEAEFVCAHQEAFDSLSCFTINAKPSASTSHLK